MAVSRLHVKDWTRFEDTKETQLRSGVMICQSTLGQESGQTGDYLRTPGAAGMDSDIDAAQGQGQGQSQTKVN